MPNKNSYHMLQSAKEYFNEEKYFEAYSLYKKAIAFLKEEKDPHPEKTLYAQLGILECKWALSLIDFAAANQEYEAIKNAEKEIGSQALPIREELIKGLNEFEESLLESKQAAQKALHCYNYASQVYEIVNALDKGERRRKNQIALTLEMLHLTSNEKNIAQFILAVENARVQFLDAISFYKDQFINDSENKQAEDDYNAAIELSSLLNEKLGDYYGKHAETNNDKQEKILFFKKAEEHYQIAITQRVDQQDETLIELHLSLLNVWEQLATIDETKSKMYVENILTYVQKQQLQQKIEAIEQEDKLQLLNDHLNFCEQFKPIESQAMDADSHSDKEEAIEENENMEIETPEISPEKNENLKADSELTPLEATHFSKKKRLLNYSPAFFDSPRIAEEQAFNFDEFQRKTFSDILRLIGDVHRQDEQIQQVMGSNAYLLAQHFYEKSIAIYPANKDAISHLSFMHDDNKDYKNVLNKYKEHEINHSQERIVKDASSIKTIGAGKFFMDMIEQYAAHLQKNHDELSPGILQFVSQQLQKESSGCAGNFHKLLEEASQQILTENNNTRRMP